MKRHINFNDVILGFNHRGHPVILPGAHRSRHAVCFGGTGYGKSKMLESVIEQDILAWAHTRTGLVLFDPHGSASDHVVAVAAERGLTSLPIVPFDCRRLDYLVSFQPLRSRAGVEPSTIVSACMDSIHHASNDWELGAPTPRLNKWLQASLTMILFSGGTIGDILAIIRSPDLRRAMTRAVQDDVARTVYESASRLGEAEFQTVTESLCNRAIRFVSATLLKLSLNQVGPSFDFGAAIRKGQIVLISLATAGGAMDETDARTLGCLLLHDLWMAAKVAGKGDAGTRRSFRVFVDETPRFLTPVLAEGMAEARGFGLQYFLLAQSTTQFQATPTGERILDSVLANCYTKIAFNTQHEADLDTLSPMIFRHNVNPDLVKNQQYSRKTLGYKLQYFDSTHHGTTHGTSDSQSHGVTHSESHTAGSSVSYTNAVGQSHSTQFSRSLGVSASASHGSGRSHAESQAESTADGTTESSAIGHTSGHTDGATDGENRHLGGDDTTLRKVVGYKPTSTFNAAYTDRYDDFRALDRSVDQTASESESDSESDSHSSSLATTRSRSNAQAMQDTDSYSESASLGMSESLTDGESDTRSVTISDSETISESDTVGFAETVESGHTESRSTSDGTTNAPMLVPLMGQEALPPQFRSVEEQLFIFSQFLSAQPDRHAVVRIGTDPPVAITTPTVPAARISPKGARAFATMMLKRLPFALKFEDAVRRLDERQKLFTEKFLGSASTGEPNRATRRIKE